MKLKLNGKIGSNFPMKDFHGMPVKLDLTKGDNPQPNPSVSGEAHMYLFEGAGTVGLYLTQDQIAA